MNGLTNKLKRMQNENMKINVTSREKERTVNQTLPENDQTSSFGTTGDKK